MGDKVALTEYPEVDIKTHRSIGDTNFAIGTILLFVDSILLLQGNAGTVNMLVLAVIGVAAIHGGHQMHVQADEWERQLNRGD